MSWTANLVDGLVEISADYYFRKEGDEKYFVAFYSVNCWALNALYLRLVNNKEIKPIEQIEQNKKEEYWRISSLYNGNSANSTRVEVTKGIYVLDLITSKD